MVRGTHFIRTAGPPSPTTRTPKEGRRTSKTARRSAVPKKAPSFSAPGASAPAACDAVPLGKGYARQRASRSDRISWPSASFTAPGRLPGAPHRAR